MIKHILKLSAHNPVLVNVLFMVVTVAGFLSWNLLPKEQFPRVNIDRIVAFASWPGAGAQDVEDLVLRPMETKLEDIDGLKHSYGDAIDGKGLLTLEFVRGTDIESTRTEVERAISEITFPEDVAKAGALQIKLNIPVIHLALTGDIRNINAAEAIQSELMEFPGVSGVDISGVATRELKIELEQSKLLKAGLSTPQVIDMIRASDIGAPAGEMDVGSQAAIIRTPRAKVDADSLSQLLLRSNQPNAPPLRISDIGTVSEQWDAPDTPKFFNGQESIVLTVFREKKADSIKMVKQIRPWIEEKAASLPDGLGLHGYDDSAKLVENRMNVLTSNALIGIFLVACFLTLFIGFRNAILVVWGMPVAYMGAVLLMMVFDLSVNVITTFSLLLVTGIIVDDAVIIVENVQRHLEMGKDRIQAAIDGTKEVFGAVMASTLTTCLAFAPLLLLEGVVGQVMSFIPLVVIFALGASLLEAFFILPGHLAHHAKESSLTNKGENVLSKGLKKLFKPIIVRIVGRKMRYGAMVVLGMTLMGIFALASTMRTSLTTEGKPYFVFVNVDLAESASQDKTIAALKRVENFAANDGKELISWISSTAGLQVDPQDFSNEGERYGQMKIGFHNDPDTFERVPAFLDQMRLALVSDPDIVDFSLELLQGGPPAGRDIDLKIRSKNAEDIFPLVKKMRTYLQENEAIYDVRDEATLGAWAYEIDVDREKAALIGLNEQQVAFAARNAYDGSMAIETSIKERNTEVQVSLAQPSNSEAQMIEDVVVGVESSGLPVRLRQVANVSRSRDLERIQRVDGERAIRISALVDPKLSTPEAEQEGIAAFFDQISKDSPESNIFFGGRLQDSKESFSSLPSIFIIAVLLIYSVLAVQFRSYLQPLIIISAIPLGLAGVALGLFSLGMDLSLIAMLGSIGLVGIVVNDALVLIDFINQKIAKGADAQEAVIDATLIRLRPILITTITTVLGLAPLGLGLAGEEPILAPMAVSISFGLAFATALSLIAVPCLYLITHDVSTLFKRVFKSAVKTA